MVVVEELVVDGSGPGGGRTAAGLIEHNPSSCIWCVIGLQRVQEPPVCWAQPVKGDVAAAQVLAAVSRTFVPEQTLHPTVST